MTKPYSFHAHRISGGIGADDQYWEALERDEFRLPRCSDCRRWTWPAHYRCGQCGSWDFTWDRVEPVGTVYTWTRCWYTFDRTAERAPDVPYVVVVAEIEAAGGARVIGALQGSEEALEVGAIVHGHIDPPSDKSKGYPALRWSLSPQGGRS
ncbi:MULTISPECIES: Zn-ribbon domain-containing OB-fold protein [unclassified Mycolicibacterium]|uniref:Zn-ribbon domain-containing OB-fold protein n=1 Tax=unclassified Mycolicibacterium TaxID=2636767 RepID=UPI0012DE7D78|nr:MULTISPECIES: zinc ribbon domain-containing protein [unclassified Mycolicibacterium]MUM24827.1 DNA-binding protein [Mycolicibacterium sp. CBMA 295]MUM38391.1 DNA-binding protein [Mycolicibacterium sp. CBMA 247]MUM44159.1 DNA-binding protein [Mycolicibacterium sp. CBMA 294]MUL82328.1 DNA-binding protein [Mycolicibacterium sp. CBMA 329]MUL88094.1 DNA-binding protein [Mycolicibacterium sp. CBMA 331]